MPGVISAGQGHMVGVNCRGHVFCSRMGNSLQDRDLYATTDVVLGRVGRVWQVWYVLLPGPHVAGTRPRVIGGGGVPLVALEGGGGAFVESCPYGADGLAAAPYPCPRIRGFCLSLGEPWLPASLLPANGRHRRSDLLADPADSFVLVLPAWETYAWQNPPMLVGGALCLAEPSHACGWCPMPGRTLPCLWVVPYAWQNPPMLVGGALRLAEPSHACGWCPMPGRTLPCLWVVPYTRQNPPMLVGGALCLVEPSHACGWCPMPGRTLPCLWVVPYAWQNPPMLVGGALCLAEPSHACGWCPIPGRTPPCLWVVPYAW